MHQVSKNKSFKMYANIYVMPLYLKFVLSVHRDVLSQEKPFDRMAHCKVVI